MLPIRHIINRMTAYPKGGRGGTLTVIQITDTHLFAEPGGCLHGVDTRARLAEVVVSIRAEHPDLVLATGDLAQDESTAAYRSFADALRRIPAPVFTVPGNHDDPDNMRAGFAGTSVQANGVCDLGGWRIVLLNSAVAGKTAGELSEAELERLDDLLASFTGKAALVCLHHPPVAIGSHWLDTIGLENAARFFAVIDRHPSVRAVLAGHVHHATEMRRGAVRYFTTPSTAIQYLPASPPPMVDGALPGYRRLTLYPDGRLETTVQRVATENA